METRSSLPCSENFDTGPYPESDEFSPLTHTLFD